MKTSKLLLASCILCAACQHQQEAKHSTQIVTVTDKTDHLSILPAADPILHLFGLNRDKNNEAYFRIASISDKQLNPAIEYHLPDGPSTESNNSQDDPYYREKVLLNFYSNVKKAIEEFNAISRRDSTLKNSECFATIASELQRMASHHAERNILLVFSDLQEKSDLFNCYPVSSQELLRKTPGKVLERFNNTHLLPNHLNGFDVYFVYQPNTREDDKRFAGMISIYKSLLESRGARVKVQADNMYLN
jgi:hypothetical protein